MRTDKERLTEALDACKTYAELMMKEDVSKVVKGVSMDVLKMIERTLKGVNSGKSES